MIEYGNIVDQYIYIYKKKLMLNYNFLANDFVVHVYVVVYFFFWFKFLKLV